MPLTDDQLLDIIESGLSDVEFMSDDDDNVEDWRGDSEDESGDEDRNVMEFEKEDQPKESGKNLSPTEHCSVELEPGENVDDPMEGSSRHLKEKYFEKARKKEVKADKEIRIDNFMKENNLTKKTDIVWMKNVTYIPPNISWHEKEDTSDPEIELESPMYFFQQYFSNNLFELMVDNTNLYAVQQHSKFLPTNLGEIKTFVGIHIVMGNCHYPRIRNYWQPKLNIPLISDNMQVNRFFKLRQHIHFVNIEEQPNNNDRL